ncbi:5-hydroxytryptamine receptor 1-like [Ochlerotatus camptorhynchus]|uniref:5-hydroxytryptamine receptor 1-like n=1 Tax=Ochlerotatus camptorhynchus TaxID=644619 RepID=UPI0031E432BB
MPLGAVYEVSKEWRLGADLCDMWTSSDVLCCTASILHLVAIALDRYWAVTDIDYAHQRTARRIGYMIIVIWTLSVLVSIAPLLGWKDPEWEARVYQDLQCIVSQDVGYQIFATASSFYVPLLVILFLYWRIFLAARKRIRRRQQEVWRMIKVPLRIASPVNGWTRRNARWASATDASYGSTLAVLVSMSQQPGTTYVFKRCFKQGKPNDDRLKVPVEETRPLKGSKAGSKGGSREGKKSPEPSEIVSSIMRAALLTEQLKLVEQQQLMEWKNKRCKKKSASRSSYWRKKNASSSPRKQNVSVSVNCRRNWNRNVNHSK